MAGFQQNGGAVGLVRVHLRLEFDSCCQRTAQQAHDKHDAEGGNVAGVAPQGEEGIGKKEVEGQHRNDGRKEAVTAARGDHGDHQHAQQIQHDNIGIGEAQITKPIAAQCAKRQDAQHFQRIPDGELLL